MRFRKARSFLSAFSNEELSGRKLDKVREQLARSESLRKEEALYRSIRKACKELPADKVSDDFNARLLDRVARERFAETRTKAYLPKQPPLFAWSKALPVAVTTVVALFVAVTMFFPSGQAPQTMYAAHSDVDDSYLTAQPDHNPNLVRGFEGGVSLQQLVNKVDRANEISNFLTGSRDFGGVNRAGQPGWRIVIQRGNVPFNSQFYRVRPVIRVTTPVSIKEGNGVY